MQQIDNHSLNYLDLIPEKLYQRLITHSYRSTSEKNSKSSLQQRVVGVLDIRHQLLKGEKLKHESLETWLEGDLLTLFYEKLNDDAILKNTFHNESFTDDLLLSALNWLEYIEDEIRYDNQLNKKPYDDDAYEKSNFNKDGFEGNNAIKTQQEVVQMMEEINKSFALERHLGWDLSKGIKSKTDVKLLLEAHRKVKNSKKIQNIVRLIGRSKSSTFDTVDTQGINFAHIKGDKFDEGIPDEHALNSVTGVCYGDDISRMLSSEMALLRHGKLKMLWHSKRAERQLLNYHFKGLLSEHVPEVQEKSIEKNKTGVHKIDSSGPVILCVDTSASMKGRPEILAKAIAFEVMRIAYLESRPCYLFSFSGKDEIIELDLQLKNGWHEILEFLSGQFNGGTDLNNVLLHAYNKMMTQQWQQADILLLSDGRFDVDKEVLENYKKIHQHSRVFGLQLGNWDKAMFNRVCHQVFDFSDV